VPWFSRHGTCVRDGRPEICNELTVHTRLEEQVLYPAAREALEESGLIDEASVEHQVAKDLIEKINQSRPHDEEY